MAGMFPTQRPPIQPTPVVVATFCSSDQPEINFLARACAAFQTGPKSGIRLEPGGGGDLGDVEGKTPGIGDAEGTGNDVNGYSEMGIVRCADDKKGQLDAQNVREGLIKELSRD